MIGAALIASAFSDALIIAAQIGGAAWLQPWIISLYSSVMLLVIGALTISGDLETDVAEERIEVSEATSMTDEDNRVVGLLDDLILVSKPFLNQDLTLSQLSRRLRIPVKTLSSAINRVTGENVSRYINAARIEAAKRALTSGETVTSAMLSSGFNTKSNFNREFLRITGLTPSAWLAQPDEMS